MKKAPRFPSRWAGPWRTLGIAVVLSTALGACSSVENVMYGAREGTIEYPGSGASANAVPSYVVKNKDTVELGQKIWRGGIAERNVPACAGCHGPNGAGIPAQYPRLGGQHSDYIEAQLTAFRDGVRTNSTQMNGVAANLTTREIKALSDYIAGLR